VRAPDAGCSLPGRVVCGPGVGGVTCFGHKKIPRRAVMAQAGDRDGSSVSVGLDDVPLLAGVRGGLAGPHAAAFVTVPLLGAGWQYVSHGYGPPARPSYARSAR